MDDQEWQLRSLGDLEIENYRYNYIILWIEECTKLEMWFRAFMII